MNRFSKSFLGFLCAIAAVAPVSAMQRSAIVSRAVEADIAAALARATDTHLIPAIRLVNITRLRQLYNMSAQEHSIGQLNALEAEIRAAQVEVDRVRNAGLLSRMLGRGAAPVAAAPAPTRAPESAAPAVPMVPVQNIQSNIPSAARADASAPVGEPTAAVHTPVQEGPASAPSEMAQPAGNTFSNALNFVVAGLREQFGFGEPVAAVPAPEVAQNDERVTGDAWLPLDGQLSVEDAAMEVPTEQDEDAMAHRGLQAGEQDVVLPAESAGVLSRLGSAGSSAWHWLGRHGGYIVDGLTAPAVVAAQAPSAPAENPTPTASAQTPVASAQAQANAPREQALSRWARLGSWAGATLRAAREGAARQYGYIKDGLLTENTAVPAAGAQTPAPTAAVNAAATSSVAVPTTSAEHAAAGTGEGAAAANAGAPDIESGAAHQPAGQPEAQTPSRFSAALNKAKGYLSAAWNFVWPSDEEPNDESK